MASPASSAGARRSPREGLRVVVSARGRLPLARARVARAVRAVVSAEPAARRRAAGRLELIQITLLGPAAMARLNEEWKGHAGPTDVLSFALPSPGGGVTGDVYICPAVARAQAREFGVEPRVELLRLVVHGTLHVLGYDHPEGVGRTRSAMWRRQERLLAGLA